MNPELLHLSDMIMECLHLQDVLNHLGIVLPGILPQNLILLLTILYYLILLRSKDTVENIRSLKFNKKNNDIHPYHHSCDILIMFRVHKKEGLEFYWILCGMNPLHIPMMIKLLHREQEIFILVGMDIYIALYYILPDIIFRDVTISGILHS